MSRPVVLSMPDVARLLAEACAARGVDPRALQKVVHGERAPRIGELMARLIAPRPRWRRSPPDPQTSWRLGGLARDKLRLAHPQPLEEPIAQSEQVAQSRKGAKSSTQPQTSPTSLSLIHI